MDENVKNGSGAKAGKRRNWKQELDFLFFPWKIVSGRQLGVIWDSSRLK